MTIKISIIIPSYNHAPYLEEAIHSVLRQSVSDFELIIIDDASSDHSWEIIQSFKDSRITAIQHQQNQGASQTINEGLSLAKGDYLTILNSDDSYHPERLARLLDLQKDFIASDVNLIDEHSQAKESQETAWVHWFENLKQDYREHQNFLATLLKGNFLITTSNFFFSRKLYQQLKGFKDLRYVHDYEFAIRALLADFQVAYLPEKLLNYRLHHSNTIREAPLKAIQENVNMLLSVATEYKQQFAQQPCYLQSLSQHLKELYQYTNEEWASQLHYKLVDKENDLFKLIHDRDQWIKERDQQIEQQNSLIDNRNKNIQENKRLIQSISNELKAQQELISKQQTWIADRDAWIKERDVLIEKQQSWIADRDGWIQERDQLIQALQDEITSLRQSRSFRLGQRLLAPFQPIKRIIKGENYA